MSSSSFENFIKADMKKKYLTKALCWADRSKLLISWLIIYIYIYSEAFNVHSLDIAHTYNVLGNKCSCHCLFGYTKDNK